MPPYRDLYQLPTYTRQGARKAILGALAVLSSGLLWASSCAATFLAVRWQVEVRLSPPWLELSSYPCRSLLAVVVALLGAIAVHGLLRGPRLVGLLPWLSVPALAALVPVASPIDFLRWIHRFDRVPALRHALNLATLVFVGSLLLLVGPALVALARRLRTLRETGDVHGSSHWATAEEVAATGLLDEGGRAAPKVVVGAWSDGHQVHPLTDALDRHVLLFATSGSGKTTCLVIPTLLTWSESMLVLDIKGELWKLTAGHLQTTHTCIRFDPSCQDGSAARYNPFFAIERGPEDVKGAMAMADALCDPTGTKTQLDFWEQAAHTLLTAVLLHVLYAGPQKTLAAALHTLSSHRDIRETFELMLRTEHDPRLQMGWIDPDTDLETQTHPVVSAVAQDHLGMDTKTSSGIVQTALTHLALFRDGIVAANTATSDFALSDLMRGDRPVALFITTSPMELTRTRGLVRLFLNQLCRQVTARLDFDEESGRPAFRHRLLLVLDEFTALGKIDFFQSAMAYLRGFGVRVFLSVQGLVQIQAVYGREESLTLNCALQITYGANDPVTARLLSDMTGTATVNFEKRSFSGSGLLASRATVSRAEVSRPLLTMEEVHRLPAEESILFVAGHSPIRGLRTPYFRDARLLALTRVPPPPRSDCIPHDWTAWTEWEAYCPTPTSTSPSADSSTSL